MKKQKNKAPTQKGFHEDTATKKFCSVLILSAIDDARRKGEQEREEMTQDQIDARYFLVARENRSMIRTLVECMGLDPDWFFERIVRRLVSEGWPALSEAFRHSSRLHGSGLYIFFDEDVKA